MLSLARKMLLRLRGGAWTIHPQGKASGRVLLSYTTLPFIHPRTIGGHTNRWECKRVAEIWNEHGFEVDIVDHFDRSFVPKKKYDFCIDVEDALERLAPKLEEDCVKIYHITSAHWKFQNEAEERRLRDIQSRRGAVLSPRRKLSPSKNIELCDLATILGNEFTQSTYAFAKKRLIRIPISTTHLFPSPETKNFKRARSGFVWLGGAGMAHKGLDLVLEAFAAMPELKLTVFGKSDPDFIAAYRKELFETPNIRFGGVVDLGSNAFREAVDGSIAMVYPSCSEGGGGSVIECMHAGLIPIVSREASVDAAGFGITLRENTISEIQREARTLAALPASALKEKSTEAWRYARAHHTRETFSKAYESFVSALIKGEL